MFTADPYKGNPVAVVMDAGGLTSAEMQNFANWTNLSETTFLVPPTDRSADYLVRIFTPGAELPFAGHPTIGTCHAWLEAGGQPKNPGKIISQCALGLVELRRFDGRLSFAAPEPIRFGPVDESDLAGVCETLNIARSEILDAHWADNGPGWLAVMLESGQAVLDLEPNFPAGDPVGIGVVGAHTLGVVGLGGTDGTDVEVRAFFSANNSPVEDPVTGSLNASVAQWLVAAGHIATPYVAAQGTAIGRAGRVHISEADGEIWVGGDAVTCVTGEVDL